MQNEFIQFGFVPTPTRLIGLETIRAIHYWQFQKGAVSIEPPSPGVFRISGVPVEDIPNLYSQALLEFADIRWSGFDGASADEAANWSRSGPYGEALDACNLRDYINAFCVARLQGEVGDFTEDVSNVYLWAEKAYGIKPRL